MVVHDANLVIFSTPYSNEFNNAVYNKSLYAKFHKTYINSKGRKFKKVRVMENVAHKKEFLWEALKECFKGRQGYSEQTGVFNIK